ncbi:MAG: carboxynorspermidine decarboxylase [Chitinispirillaceae bacterium]|nr:carboxynorspermidine decarboxylase [Chitinispirillaceae bacterium]
MAIATPYYLIDKKKLLRNLRIIKRVRDTSGAKSLLALKCFSTWCVFDLMKHYMDGTTSSSLFEARLGSEKFGGETHAYCVAWSADELRAARKYADAMIFNSVSQLKRFRKEIGKLPIGLRINPGFSHSHYDLADPARKYSRLGAIDRRSIEEALPHLSGCMFHFNCENDDFRNFSASLDCIGRTYGSILKRLKWVSLGGGLAFTANGYPLDSFCTVLKSFSDRFGVQVYLEPGEAAITRSTELVTTVLDVVRNKVDIAIVDASMEAHTLDHLIYRTSPGINRPAPGEHRYMVAGRSCLAGDVFGTYSFASRLRPGSTVRIADAAGYTMVKKNWFNGLAMPSVAVRRLSGRVEKVKSFDYHHFLNNLS